MKNIILAIRYACTSGIFACAIFVGTANAEIYNMSLLEKDGKKVVLFYDFHKNTPKSTQKDLQELEAIIQETQRNRTKTHWFLEWTQHLWRQQERYTVGMSVFFKNAFSGKYDDEYTSIENFDLRSASFIFLFDILTNFQTIQEMKYYTVRPAAEYRGFLNNIRLRDKIHTPEKYILDMEKRAQQINIMLNDLPQVSSYVKGVIKNEYERATRELIDKLTFFMPVGKSQPSLLDICTEMPKRTRRSTLCSAITEASLYTDVFMATQVLNILNESPETVVFVYAGGSHCRNIALILHSIGFQEHFQHPAHPLRYRTFSSDLLDNINNIRSTSPRLYDYKATVLDFIRHSYSQNISPQPALSIKIKSAPASHAPSHKYRAQTSMPQPSSRPAQKPAPGIKIETRPRYYPAQDPYKKALGDAYKKTWQRP